MNIESIEPCASNRLYSLSELEVILKERDMKMMDTFSDYFGKKASYKDLQLMVYSQKNRG